MTRREYKESLKRNRKGTKKLTKLNHPLMNQFWGGALYVLGKELMLLIIAWISQG